MAAIDFSKVIMEKVASQYKDCDGADIITESSEDCGCGLNSDNNTSNGVVEENDLRAPIFLISAGVSTHRYVNKQ